MNPRCDKLCLPDCPGRYSVACSGGKDSMTLLDWLQKRGHVERVWFIDTTISIPEAKEFVQGVCDERGLELEVERPPEDYESYVLRWGFPKYDQHKAIMSHLKGRCARAFRKKHPGEVMASAVRRHESQRRFQNVKVAGEWEGVTMHAPVYSWRNQQVRDYLERTAIKVSPAYKTLHTSGECQCGSYSQRDEVYLIQTFYPELAERLARLEARVEKEGRVENPLGQTWGNKGGGFRINQSRIEQFACGACEVESNGGET